MYAAVLLLHSLLRWVVLALGAAAFVRAIRGRVRGAPWTAADTGISVGWVAALDVQLLIGLVLLFFGPVTALGLQEPDVMFRSRILRFFTLEHPLMMVVAIAVAHVGRVRVRRSQTDATRHRRSALFVGLALLIILASIPWPFLPYGRPLLSWPY